MTYDDQTPQEAQPYLFDLPPQLIAQHPAALRDGSRLMVMGNGRGLEHRQFKDLPDLLPKSSLLVFNQVKVTPARLLGLKPDSGGKVEALLLDIPGPEDQAGPRELWCLAQASRRLRPGVKIVFAKPGVPYELAAEVVAAGEGGRRLLRLNFEKQPLLVLDELGHMPLPPYIKRPDSTADQERYQTVYAKIPGAAAAPTAGLHFTPAILEALAANGHSLAQVTLKVGLGTFLPLTQDQLDSGRLHREHITVPPETVAAIKLAKSQARPVIAVGTTTVRSLEWAAGGAELCAAEGWGDLFIRPGYKFKVIDGLITNFHLPGSSLMMLVAALVGRDELMRAYEAAISQQYRFFSYGDAMLIHPPCLIFMV